MLLVRCFVPVVCCLLAQNARSEQDGGGEPHVARYEAELLSGSKIVGAVSPGDVLSVFEIRDEFLLVQSPQGQRGYLRKRDAVPLSKSAGIYDQLLEEEPRNGRLYSLRGAAHWAKGDAKTAIADYDRAIKLNGKDPTMYVGRGMILATTGQYDLAIADYNKAIAERVEGYSVYTNRAAAWLGKGNVDAAIKDYTTVIEKDRPRSSHYYQRGLAYKRAGKSDLAIADFDKAIGLDPADLRAINARGFAWFQAGESKRAIADFSEVIRQDPKSALAFNNRGYNYQLSGDYKQALADYRQAVELGPEYALAWQNMAWLRAAADDPAVRNGAEAVEFATKACKLRKYGVFSDLKALAAAYAEKGDFDSAIRWQAEAIELAGDDQRAFENEILERYEAKKPFRLADVAK